MFKLGGYFFLVAVVSLLAAYYYLKNVEKLLNQSQSRVAQAIEDREAAQSQHLDEILQFRKAIECATDAIAIIGLDRQLRYINPAFVKLFGYSIEEANALGGTKSLYYDQQLGVKVYLKVSQGRSYSNEIKMLTKDNRNLEVYLRASPIFKEKSEMIGILAIFTDLSERKSTEQELLRQAQALVESNRALAEARNKASTTGENQA
jgi:PAS domain S-box-containing protein